MSDQYPPPPPPGEPTGPGTPPPPGGSMPPAPQYGAPAPAENPYGAPPPAPAYGYAAAPQAGPVTRPKTMDTAVLLMRVGAALSLVSLVLSFVFAGDIREQATQALEDSGQTVDPALVDGAVTIGIAVAVVFGLLGAGLWLFMAWANGRGKSWARITASVLFGLSLVSFLVGLTQPAAALSRVLSIVSIALGGYIVYLLWRKESSAFYAASNAPRY
ncbi:hypothetical protein [Arthrobacter sp. NEB 688]|uniref:hypothetical protein n=1 Tax=Arthrobacter sp. NEB 688 TaxID=904039 RepID=UPI0015637819|nr:hypothetical protein [Arthrobacter sp. NEB 688]QKE82696.1 hypothetical protein HL663_01145 [Arthrobacter sp. NEB 688]